MALPPSRFGTSVFVALRPDKTADVSRSVGEGAQDDFVRTMGLVLRTAWGGGFDRTIFGQDDWRMERIGDWRGARAWGRGELNIEYRTRPSPFVATEGRQGMSIEEVRGVARRAGVGKGIWQDYGN